jgi:glutathione S-transferase
MVDLHLITGNRTTSCTSLVPWLLMKELQIPFHEISIDLFRSDAVEKLGLYSPSLKVPVLIHEDIKVWDALPICEYLSETFLENRGWPAHQKKRAAARSVCAELHGDFTHFRQEWPMNCHLVRWVKPDEQLEREIARLDAIMYCCRRKFGDGGDYLFGNFSIADAFMAPFAIALHNHGAELTEKSREYLHTLLNHPHISWWLDDAQQELDAVRFGMTG